MTTRLSVDEHAATTTAGGHRLTVTVPALDQDEDEEQVVVLNDNKPCDPAKDVWSYH